jgi:hypothetical protein
VSRSVLTRAAALNFTVVGLAELVGVEFKDADQ